MNRLKISAVLVMLGAAACGDDPKPNVPADAPPDMTTTPTEKTIVNVTANIKADTVWTEDNIYVLGPRLTRIFVEPGKKLTIMPGTEVRGLEGTGLVIARGATLSAEGTAAKPIVLTSAQDKGTKTPGWWGGLLVLGAARINSNKNSTPPSDEIVFEAFPDQAELGKFGGNTPADNSGIIKYVRIEFAGFAYTTGREFNNLTLCGVGSGTTVDFVQVHRGSDDGIELFGGSVNVKHLVSSQNEDDGFDTDNGWSGKAQFIVVQNITHPAGLGEASNGYESDNHATEFTVEPRTLPTVYNVTLIGDHAYASDKNYAAVFRRGTGGHYFNHLWYNFARGPEIRDAATKAQAELHNLSIENSMFYSNDATTTNQLPPVQTVTPTGGSPMPDPNDVVELPYFVGGTVNGAAYDPHNQFVDANPGLPAAIMDKAAPSFKPATGSVMLDASKAATPPDDGFFDPGAKFIGAIGAVDWTAGWTAYPQN